MSVVLSTRKHQPTNQAQWLELLDNHADLCAQARDIAEKTNALAAISQLPAESLHAIFMLLAHMHDETQPRSFRHYDYNEQEKIPSTDYTQDIRRASQVSRAWRDLALKSPALWNAPLECVGPHSWGAELLRRSGATALNVVVDAKHPSRNWLPNYRLFVLDNLSRIERLSLVMHLEQAAIKYVKQINEHAVSLKELILTDMENEIEYSSLDLSEDEEVLGADMEDYYEDSSFLLDSHSYPPNIRSLHLGGFMIPVESPIYTNLTSLLVNGFTNQSLDVTGWCTLLSKMEKLTSLSLVECIWGGGLGKELPPILLPHLQTFRISGSKAAGRLLIHLSRAVLPPLRVLDIHISGTKPNENDFDLLMEALVKILSQYINVAEPTTLFQFLYSHGITISDRLCKNQGEDYKMKVRIQGLFDSVRGREKSLLPPLQRLFTSEPLRKYAPIPDIVPPIAHQVLAILTAPFAGLPGVEITHVSMFHNLRKLLHEGEEEGFVPIFPLSLPQVKEVIVEEMDWEVCSSYTGFKHFLQWKEDSGMPLQTLGFSPTRLDILAVAEPFCKDLGKSKTHVAFESYEEEEENDLDSNDELARYFPG